jgi:hypothetical protein
LSSKGKVGVLEDRVNLWSASADAIVITTNGFVKRNGEAVMGRGCALEAAKKWPNLPKLLGEAILMNGNHVYGFRLGTVYLLLTFPVKHAWYEKADIVLIVRSAYELVEYVDAWAFQKIVMPRPGCGNGGLNWNVVRDAIEPIFDDRFTVVTL